MAGDRCLEMADPARVRQLSLARNAKIIRKHKTAAIVEIHLLDYGEDFRVPHHWGNPQKLSTRLETDDNPPNVWMLKKVRPA
jgi:hypothetical protein